MRVFVGGLGVMTAKCKVDEKRELEPFGKDDQQEAVESTGQNPSRGKYQIAKNLDEGTPQKAVSFPKADAPNITGEACPPKAKARRGSGAKNSNMNTLTPSLPDV